MQSGQARLRIEIDGENAIGREGEMLGEMGCGGGFSAAAFEVRDSNDLQMLRVASLRNVSSARAAVFVEIPPKIENLFGSVGAPAGWSGGRRRPLPLQRQVSQIAGTNTE